MQAIASANLLVCIVLQALTGAAFVQPFSSPPRPAATICQASMTGDTKSAIKVVHTPDQATLDKLGALDWPTWGCDKSKFPWSYESGAETCYILTGKVTVIPDDQAKYGPKVTVGAGDLCTFPAGMDCTWDVHEAIRKHYNFH